MVSLLHRFPEHPLGFRVVFFCRCSWTFPVCLVSQKLLSLSLWSAHGWRLPSSFCRAAAPCGSVFNLLLLSTSFAHVSTECFPVSAIVGGHVRFGVLNISLCLPRIRRLLLQAIRWVLDLRIGIVSICAPVRRRGDTCLPVPFHGLLVLPRVPVCRLL